MGTSSTLRGIPLERETPFDPPPRLRDATNARPINRMIYFPQEKNGWLISSHELVKQVLSDPRFSSKNRRYFPFDAGLTEPRPEETVPGMFILMDPPDHTRLRRKLTGVFTVRRVRQLEDRVREIVNEHLDAMADMEKPVDLVANFALPIPSLVICELLGVPYEDREFFQGSAARTLNLYIPFPERRKSTDALKEYIIELALRKREDPQDDLLSDLAADPDLSEAELGGMGWLLLLAGHETTANMLGLSTLALLEHPDQAALLREKPELMPNAVEEMLRYLSIIQIGPQRIPTEDVEIGGQLLKAGEPVTLSVLMANRDESKFDNPEDLDVTRKTQGHFAFGHGVHQCLGQQLARIEMVVALEALLNRLPDLQLAVPRDEVRLRTDMTIFGVYELPVTW